MFQDGKLYAPEWGQGLRKSGIRSLPHPFALIVDLKKQLREKQSEGDEALKVMVEAERRARYYLAMLVLGSRYGLMLLRIGD